MNLFGANTTDLPADDDLAKRVRLYLIEMRREFWSVLVSAEDGSIRLGGSVSSFYLRQLAVAVARRVAGVRHVEDTIFVEDSRIRTKLRLNVPSITAWNLTCEQNDPAVRA